MHTNTYARKATTIEYDGQEVAFIHNERKNPSLGKLLLRKANICIRRKIIMLCLLSLSIRTTMIIIIVIIITITMNVEGRTICNATHVRNKGKIGD